MTNSYILIIHKIPILFNILNEINSILNFEIKKVDDEKINDKLFKKNLVIISKENKYYTQNQIKIKDFPINLTKLIELVNIQFLKTHHHTNIVISVTNESV